MLEVMVAAAGVWLALAVAILAVILAMAAIARTRGRRLQHDMVQKLGRRWEPVPESPANDGDLRITLDELLSQRDELLEEFQAVQAQITVLKRRVDRRKPVAVLPRDDDESVIRLHEVLPEEWAERRRR
jgi:hypothetical protein